MRALLIAAVATAAALAAATSAQAHRNGGLGFRDAKELTLQLGEDGRAATATVLVENTAHQEIVPTFSLFLRTAGGGYQELQGAAEDAVPVKADSAQRYDLRFDGAVEEGATGHLVAVGAGSPGTVDVEVERETSVAVPAGLAVALVLALLGAGVAVRLARRPAHAH